jgi:hypothetical protein
VPVTVEQGGERSCQRADQFSAGELNRTGGPAVLADYARGSLMSVCSKSSPLNRSGRFVAVASA